MKVSGRAVLRGEWTPVGVNELLLFGRYLDGGSSRLLAPLFTVAFSPQPFTCQYRLSAARGQKARVQHRCVYFGLAFCPKVAKRRV